MTTINYIWVGKVTSSGHDVIGPKIMAAKSTDEVVFWCLESEREEFEQIFANDAVTVCSIESLIAEYSHSTKGDPYSQEMRGLAKEMERLMDQGLYDIYQDNDESENENIYSQFNIDIDDGGDDENRRGKGRDKQNVKDCFSLFLLATKPGQYVLDTNVVPANLKDSKKFSLPAIKGEGKIILPYFDQGGIRKDVATDVWAMAVDQSERGQKNAVKALSYYLEKWSDLDSEAKNVRCMFEEYRDDTHYSKWYHNKCGDAISSAPYHGDIVNDNQIEHWPAKFDSYMYCVDVPTLGITKRYYGTHYAEGAKKLPVPFQEIMCEGDIHFFYNLIQYYPDVLNECFSINYGGIDIYAGRSGSSELIKSVKPLELKHVSLLQIAIIYNRPDIVYLLLNMGATINEETTQLIESSVKSFFSDGNIYDNNFMVRYMHPDKSKRPTADELKRYLEDKHQSELVDSRELVNYIAGNLNQQQIVQLSSPQQELKSDVDAEDIELKDDNAENAVMYNSNGDIENMVATPTYDQLQYRLSSSATWQSHSSSSAAAEMKREPSQVVLQQSSNNRCHYNYFNTHCTLTNSRPTIQGSGREMISLRDQRVYPPLDMYPMVTRTHPTIQGSGRGTMISQHEQVNDVTTICSGDDNPKIGL